MRQWLISWNKMDHSLTWVYGDIKQAFHPVTFMGIEQHSSKLPVCASFPVIYFREWNLLLQLRKEFSQGLVPAMQELNDNFFDQITKDVFPSEYSESKKGVHSGAKEK